MSTGLPPVVELSAGARNVFRALAAVGIVTAAAGALLAADRMWANWLLVNYYALGLGLAGLCLVAIHYTTGAHWSVVVRRVPEALAGTIPLTAAALAVAFLARPELHPWTQDTFAAAADPTLAFKQAWLSRPFFLGRTLVYLAIWALFAFALLRHSRRQDLDGEPRWTLANVRLSAAFLVLFGLTFTLATIDWIMSLEPAWYSTIFAVYNFAGLMLAGLAASIIVAVWLERSGPLHNVLSDEHLHDLAKLLFAFSTFWMYIWFSQYMLIWYANIPEETEYFVRRTNGGWAGLFVGNIVLNWVVPFFVLMRRDVKRWRALLVRVCYIVLIGRWLDLYLMILPPVVGDAPAIGLLEIGLSAGSVGLFGLALVQILRAAPAVPLRDPQLFDSLHYEQ